MYRKVTYHPLPINRHHKLLNSKKRIYRFFFMHIGIGSSIVTFTILEKI
jgi:hypothetical protein